MTGTIGPRKIRGRRGGGSEPDGQGKLSKVWNQNQKVKRIKKE